MPCVVKLKPEGRSPFWFACYTDPTGRRLKKSTKLTSRSKALEMARKLQKASDEARRGVLTEARARELLSEMVESVNGETLRVFTVRQWLDHFVKQKQKSRSDKTAARHEQTTREFLEFLGPRADVNIAAITSKDIAAFRDARESKGLAPATVNLDVVILSAAFSSGWKQGHVRVNPCAAIEKLKDNAQRKGTFSIEQVKALIASASGDMRGLIMLGFYLGARLGDCKSLKWKSVDFNSHTIRFRPRKTGTEIVTAIHPSLEDFLLSIPAPESDEAFILPSLGGATVASLSKRFNRLMDAAHIEQRLIRERSHGGRSVNALSFHSFRHTFTSILANCGVSEERRMKLSGHTTRDVHQGYTQHDIERLREAVSVLPNIATEAGS